MEDAGKPVEMICNVCRTNAVTRDAWAEWDATEQRWVLGSVFDYAHCRHCDGDTKIVEVNQKSRQPVSEYDAMLLANL